MASFDENGKYIKTNWKAGDKITATKLNKIEESIEAVNDNDISRHVEADARLDALEAKDVAHDKEFTNVKNTIANNKAAAELGDYEINSRMTFLENELNEGIEEVHNVASTVDGKIATAEANMTSAVNQGKADMEAMVAEMENEIDNIYYVKPEMFEGDDTTKIRNALSSGKNVLLTASSYTLSSSIDVPIGVDIKAYKNVVIYPATTAQFNLMGNNVIDGLTIDGQNDQYIGLQIQGSNITIKNCTIKNLLYSASYGIRDYRTNGEFFNNISIHDCEFDNISCIPNSVQGDGAGSCRAIALSYSRYINIYNNKFTNLQEYEDSDYVHIGSGQSIDTQEYPYCEFENRRNSDVYCNIYNNTFENFKKSAVKIQASSCKIYDNYFIANERTTMAMRGYSSENVEFINNKIQYNSPTDNTETAWMTSIWNFEYCKNLTVKNNIVTGDCGVFDYLLYFKYVADVIIQNNIIEMPNSRSRTLNNANSLCIFRLLGKNVNVINNKIHLAGSITAYFIERATSLTDEIIFDHTIDSNRLDVPINYLIATQAKSAYPNTNMTLSIYNDTLVKNDYYVSGISNAGAINQADVYINQCDYGTVNFRITGSNLIIRNSTLNKIQIQSGIKTSISKCFFTPAYESITLNNPGELRISNCELDDGIYMFTAYRAYTTSDKVQIVNTTIPAQITYNGNVIPQSIDRLSMCSWAGIPSDILPSILCISHNGDLEGYNYGTNNLIPKFNVPINTRYYDTTNKKELRFNGTVWE